MINEPIYESKIPQVQTDATGNKFIINEKGKKVIVIINEFGEECIRNEDGYIIPIEQAFGEKDA